MDGPRFDTWTRRRFGWAAGAALAAQTSFGLHGADAMEKRRKKPRPNAFGCLDVGQPCRGKDARCCSDICRGKKPKQGARDRSRCVAHDAGGCRAGQQGLFCGGTNVDCTSSAGIDGVCDTTTGNAGYCAFTTTCSPCRKDADCRPVCGPGAACVKCAACIEDGGTRCVGAGPDACIFD